MPPDLEAEDVATFEAVRHFTMTSPERIASLCAATRYITRAGVPGAIVECGVWRGGSMMAAALTLVAARSTARELFLFDTFEGMTQPTDRDISLSGDRATDLMRQATRSEDDPLLCYAPLEGVRRALLSTGYPSDRVRFVPGRVEDTIPAHAPERIALLRLDTDWYESTRHELAHLFPRLSRGGVLIIDDYGHWQGARAAVDEFIASDGHQLLLNRIDYTGRVAVKVFD